MKILNFKTLFPYLYSLYTEEGRNRVYDVKFKFRPEKFNKIERHYFRITSCSLKTKLCFLRGRYKFKGPNFIGKGCLKSISLSGVIKFTKTSQWFKKLITDLSYCYELRPLDQYTVYIPDLWIRDADLLAMGLCNQIKLLKRHKMKRDHLLKKYDIDSVVHMKNNHDRGYYMQYYYVMGDITLDQRRKYFKYDPERMKIK